MVNNANLAFLFPGQGSQYPGMGKSLVEYSEKAKNLFDQAADILGYSIKDKIFNGTEQELRQTVLTQPAIFLVSCAAFAVFAEAASAAVKNCRFVAGHSLGEYSAFYASGAFDFQTALKLVEYRAKILQEACAKKPGAMAAIIGLNKEKLRNLCNEIRGDNSGEVCEMVNFNSPSQIVVAGTANGVQRVLEKTAGEKGARGIPLNVSGAFHSSLMTEAALQMRERLQTASISNPKIPVVTNWDAAVTASKDEIPEKLFHQMDHAVLWEETIRNMTDQGVNVFIEIGPGKVLSGLVKKIDRTKKTLNVEDLDSLKQTIQEAV